MIKIPSLEGYFGGKSGNGTYQTIINHIPPHRVYASLYLGNCGVTRMIRPAQFNVLNDMDTGVMNAWGKANLKNPLSYSLLNLPALDVLKELSVDYNGKEDQVFIYLDPPYPFETRKNPRPVYKYGLSQDGHNELLSAITQSKFRIAISSYPNDVYDMWLSGWRFVDFKSMTRHGLADERLYMNYRLTGELHDYSFLGKDFREREAYNRMRKNLVRKLCGLSAEQRNAMLSDISAHFKF